MLKIFIIFILSISVVQGHPYVYFLPGSDVPHFNEHYKNKDGLFCSNGERPQHCHGKAKSKTLLEEYLALDTTNKILDSMDAMPVSKGVKASIALMTIKTTRKPILFRVRHQMPKNLNKRFLNDIKNQEGLYKQYKELIRELKKTSPKEKLPNNIVRPGIMPRGYIEVTGGLKSRGIVSRSEEGWVLHAFWWKIDDKDSTKIINSFR